MKRHDRRSMRLKDYDYSMVGWYYVSIVTKNRECLFGNIADGVAHLNDYGNIVEEEWLKTPLIRPNVELDGHIVMPNHVHGIVIIGDLPGDLKDPVGTHCSASLQRMPQSLGSIIGGFKSAVTKRINILRSTPGTAVWQGRFYDHIIRNDSDLHRIREYIRDNPLRWGLNEENAENLTG